MKQKLKNSIEINKKIKIRNTQRGITLVALVITIIVLLILAMVSVKIAIDGGLITKASKATDTHTIGAEKEAIQTGYASYQMAIVKGENVSKPTIKGAEVLEEPNNSWLVRFKKNTYTIDNNGVTLGPIKSEVDMSIKEGDKVKYSYDGTKENEKEWIVLYKDEKTKTAEIISPEAIGKLTLGCRDTEAQGKNDFEKAIYSYNHAIERINDYTASLVTNPNKISVRSVGSNPSDPNKRNTEKYKSDELESWNCKYDGKIVAETAKMLEGSDRNESTDEEQMKKLGIFDIGEFYWVSSREVLDYNDSIYFSVLGVNLVNSYFGAPLLVFYSDSRVRLGTNPDTSAVRPVVKISLNS